MVEPTFRFAEPSELRAVLSAYWKCFDATQRLRTVAHSPFLFRFFYSREMKAGRCQIAVALEGHEITGFAIVREDGGPGKPWLLSAIGVVPDRRRGGVARRLFQMVATRPLHLTVEVDGPVGFYESLGLKKSATTTLLYVRKRDLGVLRALAGPEVEGAAVSGRTINWSASFVKASQFTPLTVKQIARRTRFGKTAVVEIPGPFEGARKGGVLTVHELAMATPDTP